MLYKVLRIIRADMVELGEILLIFVCFGLCIYLPWKTWKWLLTGPMSAENAEGAAALMTICGIFLVGYLINVLNRAEEGRY